MGCNLSRKTNNTRKNKTRIIRGSANTAYVHRAHQIYYYITLNELQIVDQQISLTQCISHSLEKIHTLCFAHSLRKILHLYFSCSLEGTLSLLFPLSLHSLEEALFFLQVVLFYLCCFLSNFGVSFKLTEVPFYRPSFMLHGQQSPSSGSPATTFPH